MIKKSKSFIEVQTDRLAKLPKSGQKVQSEFRAFAKHWLGVDLEPAMNPWHIDKWNSDRRGFYVDVEKISVPHGSSALSELKNHIAYLSNDKSCPFDVKVSGWDGRVSKTGGKVYRIDVTQKNK